MGRKSSCLASSACGVASENCNFHVRDCLPGTICDQCVQSFSYDRPAFFPLAAFEVQCSENEPKYGSLGGEMRMIFSLKIF